MIGRMVGHYSVIAELGRGGMGEVFLAEDTTLKRRVAIKKLPATLEGVSRWVGRLRREAEALAAVNHPNVITVHAIEDFDGVPFLVTEFVEGSTVAELLPERGFAAGRFFELAIPIASAIAAAHARGVVHGDIKPGNVMVSTEGRVKVLDFGLAKIVSETRLDAASRTTAVPGVVMGTVPYMSLEQLVGEPPDRRSDLFSLGAMMFEMATGRLPFRGNTVAELARRLATESAPDLAAERPDLPHRLGRLLASVLDRDPAKRPTNTAFVAEELERSLRESHPGSTSPAPTAAPVRRPVDVEVVQLVARGRHLWNRRSEESLRMAVSCFQQAIDRDPLHAAAWIGMADALNILSNYGFVRAADCCIRVRAAVERAIALDGESADALRALALAAWQFDFDWAEAERLYEQALEIDGDAPLSHYWYGVMLGATRRFEECFARMRRAESLDPLSLIVPAAHGWFTLFSGRPADGHVMLRRVLSLDPQLHPALWFDGQALSALGRHDEAIASFTEAIRIGGRTTRMLGYLGYAFGNAGRTDEAARILAELRHTREEQYVPPYFDALVLCGLGERTECLTVLEIALREKDTMIRDLAVDPPWWALRTEPRYRVLIETMGLSVPRS